MNRKFIELARVSRILVVARFENKPVSQKPELAQ